MQIYRNPQPGRSLGCLTEYWYYMLYMMDIQNAMKNSVPSPYTDYVYQWLRYQLQVS